MLILFFSYTLLYGNYIIFGIYKVKNMSINSYC
nr:MAG TPA: hypothetical protein [Caudoviricetes sp.]DAI46309.1 MAG TPA: hypothetical protein [Caudoviricetes sp.]DAR73386.1 MAG TPA: hypothetical protein [Caudoviricetes sp.]DAV23390.1 MAG TPA: hypothetical protein [Bacteriophage sp.]DAZ58392.1 MAG TPA: hypothetical protein [Caudoviricetes sp.]